MPLAARRCPRCLTGREEFFEICLHDADQRWRQAEEDRRREKRAEFLFFVVAASLILAAGYWRGDLDNARGILLLCMATLALAVGSLRLLK